MAISFKQLNQKTACEKQFFLAFLDVEGNSIETCEEPQFLTTGEPNPAFKSELAGVFIIGSAAREAEDFNERRYDDFERLRHGKLNKKFKGAKELGEDYLDKAVLFTKAWVGFKEDFNEKNLRELYETIPTFLQQAYDAHNDLSNFFPKK